jgi:hypothetical protein
MSDAGWTAVAALGASALTAVTSFLLIAYRERHADRASARSALHKAVVELLTRSLAITLQAKTAGDMMKVRSGLIEGVDIATHTRKPLDHLELHDWMFREWGPLTTAWGEIWTRGDQKLIRLANDLIDCCAEIAGVSTEHQPAATTPERVRRYLVGERWTKEMLSAHEASLKRLAHARRDLALHGRANLGVGPVDLFTSDL